MANETGDIIISPAQVAVLPEDMPARSLPKERIADDARRAEVLWWSIGRVVGSYPSAEKWVDSFRY